MPYLLFIILSLFILSGFVLLFFFLKREMSRVKNTQQDQTLIAWLNSMQKTIDATNHTLNETMRGSSTDVTRTLQANTKQLNERLDMAAKVIGDVQKQLGELSEVGRGIKSLQEFLQSPKLRGNIGEQVLADMIGQTFPKNAIHLQYPFRSGAKVDAMLKTDGGMLCIDAKFPMENFTKMHSDITEKDREIAQKAFTQDVKKHIADISKKYILPEEGTLDFALMYIPAESVYYEIVNQEDIMTYARDQRVYPVSPNTLYAHLQVLLLSFQGKELEQKSRELFTTIRSIQKEYQKSSEQIAVLGRHINNAYNTMNTVSGSFMVLGQKINKNHILEENKTADN